MLKCIGVFFVSALLCSITTPDHNIWYDFRKNHLQEVVESGRFIACCGKMW